MIYLQDKKINKFGNNKIYLKDKLVYQSFFKPTILNGVIKALFTTTSENKNVLITGKKEYFDSITLENGTEILSTGTGTLYYTFAEQGTYKISYKLKNNITTLSYIFYNGDLNNIDLSNIDTSNVTNISYMFNACGNLTDINLSNFDTSNVTNMSQMFAFCTNLQKLDLSGFDTSKVTKVYQKQFMFYNCSKLNHIKCKQAFKDWCITNQDTINLPTALREGGNGTWEIV